MIDHIQMTLRGWILDFVHNNQGWLPDRLHWYLLHGLPFHLSIIDIKSPLTDEDIAIIDELVAKYGVNPEGDGLQLERIYSHNNKDVQP